MTARAHFKQSDVTRAINGVQAAGLAVARVEIEGDRIVVLVGDQATMSRRNPLDSLYGA